MYLRRNSLGRQNFVAHIYETRNKTKISQWKVFLEVSRLIQVKKRERERERERGSEGCFTGKTFGVYFLNISKICSVTALLSQRCRGNFYTESHALLWISELARKANFIVLSATSGWTLNSKVYFIPFALNIHES